MRLYAFVAALSPLLSVLGLRGVRCVFLGKYTQSGAAALVVTGGATHVLHVSPQ